MHACMLLMKVCCDSEKEREKTHRDKVYVVFIAWKISGHATSQRGRKGGSYRGMVEKAAGAS